jgi:hypothetical protein
MNTLSDNGDISRHKVADQKFLERELWPLGK